MGKTYNNGGKSHQSFQRAVIVPAVNKDFHNFIKLCNFRQRIYAAAWLFRAQGIAAGDFDNLSIKLLLFKNIEPAKTMGKAV